MTAPLDMGAAALKLVETAPAPKPRVRKKKVADLFCGAGGSSTGAKRALERLGFQMDLLCVNHWPTAISTHSKNHPEARHYCQDVATVRPHLAVPEGKLDLLMASPTCTFHSRARGGKPISDQQRMDPWHIITWLTELRVKCLLVENVPEFIDWGPVDTRTGRPIRSRKGEYFVRWLETIRGLGFKVDWRIMNAADYGDATTRERFFLIARSDGKQLAWPNPTHCRVTKGIDLFGDTLKPWRPAREIIDWSVKGRSIFNRKRPLSPNTLARIYAGIVKFGWPEPFIVMLRNHMDAVSLGQPLPTICAGGWHAGIAEPIVFQVNQGGDRQRNMRGVDQDPLQTVVTRPSLGMVEPFMISTRQHTGGPAPRSVDAPMPTATASDSRIGVVEPFMMSGHADGAPRSTDDPMPGMTAKNNGPLLVEPLIAPYYGSGSGETCHSTSEPLPTVTTKGRFGIVMPVTHGGDPSSRARSVDEPIPTVTTAARGELAFLEPGRDFDILFRMLEPHELAAAMGFTAEDQEYEFTGTKTDVIKQIGNSVPVHTAEALVGALMAS